jgi:hypothetical protein
MGWGVFVYRVPETRGCGTLSQLPPNLGAASSPRGARNGQDMGFAHMTARVTNSTGDREGVSCWARAERPR